NVSKRKMDSPWVLVCDSPCKGAEIRIATEMVAVEKINRNMAYFSSRPCDPSVPVQLDAEGRGVQVESCQAFSASAVDLQFLGGMVGQISCFCNSRGKRGRTRRTVTFLTLS